MRTYSSIPAGVESRYASITLRASGMGTEQVRWSVDGKPATLPGRSLLFVRNVGHLLTNPAIRGALAGRWINVLITDRFTAARLVQAQSTDIP